MESLNDSTWDVVIAGTGLYQSFLALALSRSGKKILHVDKRDYYGGPDAAFSLQEAEDWVDKVNQDPGYGPFKAASIVRGPEVPKTDGGLSFSRAYTLSLSPQLIYSRSNLLPSLVSSRIFRQLEFQAVGSWWVHHGSAKAEDGSFSGSSSLRRVPSSREDVFADELLSMKSKRSLMKFLRHLQAQEETPEQQLDTPFPEFLKSKLQVPSELYDPLMSLSLTPKALNETSASYAVQRINRHLQSLGVYGPGFASMLLKWGGGAEISQVACRACAVGGGVYVLNRGIKHIGLPESSSPDDGDDDLAQVELSNGESVRSKVLVGSRWDLPSDSVEQEDPTTYAEATRSVMIVSSPLETLFPTTSEGGPVSVGTVVAFPGQAVSKGDASDTPPVYLIVHSSETGECPTGQCVIYGSTLLSSEQGYSAIELAANRLLESVDSNAKILWTLQYTQLGPLESDAAFSVESGPGERVLSFPAPCLDLAFDDGMIDRVKRVWQTIMGGEVDASEFLVFEDREGAAEEEEG